MNQIPGIVSSTEQRIVALEAGKDGTAVLFRRTADDQVEQFTMPYRPYLLLSSPGQLYGLPVEYETEMLSGHQKFCCLASFSDSAGFDAAKKWLKNSPQSSYSVSADLVQQALIQHRIRLFAGMTFEQVRRMQIDIETLCSAGYDFSNAEREDDAVCIIGMSDNTGWECTLDLTKMTEKEMLEKFVSTVRERDPDIIEGHNLFRFDLPYLEARAKRHKVKLALGRNGSTPARRSSRINIAERTVNYTRYDIYGRHIADTYHLALFYDAVRRDLDGYGLKSVAKHFGVAAPDRVYLDLGDDCENMNHAWQTDPERCLKYCLDDVRETRAVAEILSPASFYQTQIIPLSYQNGIVRGNATKIDAIFTAEYLTRHLSLPAPEMPRPFSGALTKSFDAGVFKDVMHCDVRSLYPSILIAGGRGPERDEPGIFLQYLSTLRKLRLEMKDAAKNAKDARERDCASSLQSTFKILINSFYGYLGFAQGFLNDYDLAESVTARGREILTMMLDHLVANGANPVEMDTDGIYFQAPAEISQEQLAESLAKELPPGISVEFDEKYKAMFSYKSKNYALLKENGELVIAGAALKSRGLEGFQRDYIRDTVYALLTGDSEFYRTMDQNCENALRNHTYPFSKLAKSENLSDSPETYTKKVKVGGAAARRSAAYELALKSGRQYRAGDQISFYITGNKKNVTVADAAKLLSAADPDCRDENVPYYLAKLEELRKKFAPFTSRWATPADNGQMLFDL